MDEIIVRRALRKDNQAIIRLIHRVHINPLGLEWRRFYIAETREGNLLGCGQIKPHADGSREMASIAVAEESRGRGVARVIISRLLIEEPKRPLYLTCRARLSDFYQKFGFHPIRPVEMPKYFSRIYRAERIFNTGEKPENRLMIMRLD